MNDEITVCPTCGIVEPCTCPRRIEAQIDAVLPMPANPNALTAEEAKELVAERGRLRVKLGASLSNASTNLIYDKWKLSWSRRATICPDCKLSNADKHYDEENQICWIYEAAWSDQPRERLQEAK